MPAPTRGSEETLKADSTSIAAGDVDYFDWDLTAAFFGRFTIKVTFPGSGQGDLELYAAYTEKGAPAAADYPARAESLPLGVIPATVSATKIASFELPQGLAKVRVNNKGSGTITADWTRGRKYT